MSIRKGSLLSVVFSLWTCCLFAQSGAPPLSQYSESKKIENQSWAICQDADNVMMFANRRGLLTFDGEDWGSVLLPVIPYAIKSNPQDKRVYVGGDNNYGYLLKDDKGIYNFTSLNSDSAGIGIISQIIFTDSTVYFYSDRSISRHNLLTGKLENRLVSPENKPFTGMFTTHKNVFVNVLSGGLFRIESDTLFPIVTGYQLENDEILFSLPNEENLVLLGLGTGDLKLFDGIKFYDWQVKDDGYLQQNILSEGLLLYDSLYAFSTLDGGALIVDKKGHNIRFTINNQIGLPDDEVFALGSDNSGGLWLSHQYGLTRADLFLPVRSFTMYPGLKGNLLTSTWYQNELYVGTSEGVFYLSATPDYAKVEVLVENLKLPALGTGPSLIQPVTQLVVEQPKVRKSLFTRIFGKKSETPPPAETSDTKVDDNVHAESVTIHQNTEPKYIKKTVSRLRAINYNFTKVQGLNEKCRQLVNTENGILASTNKGLYIISGHSAKAIVDNRYINFVSQKSEDNKYYVAASDGYFYVTSTSGKWSAGYPDKNFIQPLYSVCSTDKNTLWAGGDGVIYKIGLSNILSDVKNHTYSIKSDFLQRCIVESVNDTLFLFTETGILFYDKNRDLFESYIPPTLNRGFRTNFIFTQAGSPWILDGEDWIYLRSNDKVAQYDRSLLKIPEEIISIYTDKNNIWVIDGKNQLFRLVRGKGAVVKANLDLFVKSISNEDGLSFNLSDIVFERGDNIVKFEIVAPFYLKSNSTQYQYTVDNVMSSWSEWSNISTITLMIEPGKYNLLVRAKDIWGNISETQKVAFTIKAPFTETSLFFVLVLLMALFLIILIVRYREKQLKKDKQVLEAKVKERTAEIEAQKQEITSSIEYASRIQMAMLPTNDHFQTAFSDHFIFFRPRDIVSGDFYWIGEDEKHIYLTVADCTGHGVPGAFMSTMGISTLNEIITNKSDLQANTVLNLLREKTKTALHQTGKEGEAADGMDISFCIIHKDKSALEFSGAYNPMFIFQGGEFKEYKADRMPIGIHYGEKESFTNYEINIKEGDTIYLFSDGFCDQFGGADGCKYKKSNLKRLFTEMHHRPMSEQHQILTAELESWRGKSEQVDDITIIGIRI